MSPLTSVSTWDQRDQICKAKTGEPNDKVKDSKGWGPVYLQRVFFFLLFIYIYIYTAFRTLSPRHRSTQSEINAGSISQFQTVADIIYIYKYVYISIPAVYAFLPFFLLLSNFSSALFIFLSLAHSKEEHEKHLCFRRFGVALAGDRPPPVSFFCSVMPFLRCTQGPAGFFVAASCLGPIHPPYGTRFHKAGVVEKSANDSKVVFGSDLHSYTCLWKQRLHFKRLFLMQRWENWGCWLSA